MSKQKLKKTYSSVLYFSIAPINIPPRWTRWRMRSIN